jgi:hypothetical protein
MTYKQLKDAIADVVLEVFDLEIRGAKIPPGEPTYVISMVCVMSEQPRDADHEAINAILGINGDVTWSTALSLMQVNRGEVGIQLKFAKKRTEPPRCTLQ